VCHQPRTVSLVEMGRAQLRFLLNSVEAFQAPGEWEASHPDTFSPHYRCGRLAQPISPHQALFMWPAQTACRHWEHQRLRLLGQRYGMRGFLLEVQGKQASILSILGYHDSLRVSARRLVSLHVFSLASNAIQLFTTTARASC
jgi:hypothetical protein